MDEIPAPRTSVVFVSRDALEAMRRSLASLEKLPERSTLEIVVVDNGSTDGTAELDAEFPTASFLRLPRNFGRVKALNIGSRTAKGEYLLFAEPGTIFPPTSVAQLVARLDEDFDAAAACPYTPKVLRLPRAGDLYAEWKGSPALQEVAVEDGGSPAPVDYPRGVPMLVRRNFLAGMRYLDEQFGDSGYDADLCRQIRGAGKKILVLPWVRMEYPERTAASGVVIASVDQLNSAAAYEAKYGGTWAGMQVRLGAALHLLGRMFTFRSPGFDFGRLRGVLSARKIDGEQEG